MAHSPRPRAWPRSTNRAGRRAELRILVILVLAPAIAFVIAIGRAETGPAEKLALLALTAGCIFLATQVTKLAARTRRRIQRR